MQLTDFTTFVVLVFTWFLVLFIFIKLCKLHEDLKVLAAMFKGIANDDPAPHDPDSHTVRSGPKLHRNRYLGRPDYGG